MGLEPEMSISINQGENFYYQTFGGLWVPDEISIGVEIAPKVWAGRGLPVVPGEHWEKWLGELPFRDIRTGLVLIVTAPQPGSGHFFNSDLKRKLNHLTFGLILRESQITVRPSSSAARTRTVRPMLGNSGERASS